MFKTSKIIFFLALFSLITSSCGIYKYSDARENSTNADERIKKSMETGKGFRLGTFGNKGSGEFMFASSNPLWRATMEKLDFAPLNNVDYAGGIVVTDWFNDGDSNEYMKITVRFLSNEIRADGLQIILHKKTCGQQFECVVGSYSSKVSGQIKLAILKRAAIISKMDEDKYLEENGKVKIIDNPKF